MYGTCHVSHVAFKICSKNQIITCTQSNCEFIAWIFDSLVIDRLHFVYISNLIRWKFMCRQVHCVPNRQRSVLLALICKDDKDNPKSMRNLKPIDDTKRQDAMFNNLTESLNLYRSVYPHMVRQKRGDCHCDGTMYLARCWFRIELPKETRSKDCILCVSRTERKFNRYYGTSLEKYTLGGGRKGKSCPVQVVFFSSSAEWRKSIQL